MINNIDFILYVADQGKSRDFYKEVLLLEPVLDVEGMTEFQITSGAILGLMPEKGISKILAGKIPDPALGSGIPRCELYLYVHDPEIYFKRGIAAGAKPVSPVQKRSWGDSAGYISDSDGHIIAFAAKQ
jgi:lactoylglutathione lyase